MTVSPVLGLIGGAESMLSIVVTWRDRVELTQALPTLLDAARAVNGDVTVVNYDGSTELLEAQLGTYSPFVRVVYVQGQQYFNKPRAQNLGAANTDQPILFFCDCDILLEARTLSSLVERVASEEGFFATLAGVRESRVNSRRGGHVTCFGYELQIRTADGRSLRIVDHEEDALDGTRNAPGLLLVRRADFLAIQGYNSRLLTGWGWDDQDIIARLTLGAGLQRIIEGHAIHISHDDDARIAHYPSVKDRWESRDKMFRQALANYDRADFMGSYDLDVAEVPVRVLQMN